VAHRRRSFKEWSNSPGVAGAFLAVTAVVCAVAAVVNHHNAVALRDHGLRTRGLVVDVHDGKNSYVVVEFVTTAGEQVGNYYWRPHPRSGDTPELLYDPDDPTGNVADVRMGPDFFSFWAAALGGLLAAVTSWLTFTRRIDWMRWTR
jgi:hypothetical protein